MLGSEDGLLDVDASLGRGSDRGGGPGVEGADDGVCDGVGSEGRELDGVGGDGMGLGGDWVGEGRLGGLGGDGIDGEDGTDGVGIDGDGIGGMMGVWQPATVNAAMTTPPAIHPAAGLAASIVSLAPITLDVLLPIGV